MDSQNFIIGFVKIIERHPVLYDQKLPHRTSHQCSLTWEKVAEEVKRELKEDCAVDDLKTKWKGIRSSYARFKRKIEKSKNFGSKQYYLYDSLSFLRPHIKHWPSSKSGGEKLDGYQSSDVEEWDSQISVNMMTGDTNDSNSLGMPEYDNLVYSSVKIEPADEDQLVDTTGITSDGNQLNTENEHTLKRRTPIDIFEKTTAKVQKWEENADLQFFKSVLPDIDQFTKSEKRKFKMGVLKLIDDIESSRQENQDVGRVYMYKATDQ